MNKQLQEAAERYANDTFPDMPGHEYNNMCQQARRFGFSEGAEWQADQSPWRPISEAPLDGTKVDLIVEGSRKTNCDYCNGFWWQYGDRIFIEPTHFALIPDQPKID